MIKQRDLLSDFKSTFTYSEVIENTTFNNFTPLLTAAKFD